MRKVVILNQKCRRMVFVGVSCDSFLNVELDILVYTVVCHYTTSLNVSIVGCRLLSVPVFEWMCKTYLLSFNLYSCIIE